MKTTTIVLACSICWGICCPASGMPADPGQDLVEIRGISQLAAFNDRAYTIIGRQPTDPPLVVPLRDGDILLPEDDGVLFPYNMEEDGKILNLWVDEPVLRVNSHPRILAYDENQGKEWLLEAPEDQLAKLRLVLFDEDPPDLAALRRLAANNPDVGLGLEEIDNGEGFSTWLDTDPDLIATLAAFEPRFLMVPLDLLALLQRGEELLGEALTEEERQQAPSWLKDPARSELFRSWSSVETLVTSLDIPASLETLADLPELRNLVLLEWDQEEAATLPNTMENLVSLYLFDCELLDLHGLAGLTGLQRLTLTGESGIGDLSGVTALPSLRSIDLSWCEELADISPLFDVEGLEHIGFPRSVTQEQFAELVERIPGLRSIDVSWCEQVEDLAPVASLPGLSSLAVGPQTNLSVLADSSTLRHLRIQLDDEKEAKARQRDVVAQLGDSLPHIVTSVGFCLGSGYILALIPVVAGALVLARRLRGEE